MSVSTPADFEALKKGHIGDVNDSVIIDWNAHPDILSQPIHFAHAQFSEISFVDEFQMIGGNIITLHPSDRQAKTIFFSGENLTLGIPSDYAEYFLIYYQGATISEFDLDYVFKWTKATRLEVFDDSDSDVVYQLSKRIDEFSALTHLRKIAFNIHSETYGKLNLGSFLTKLPELKEATFHAKDVTFVDIEKFVNTRMNVSEWNCVAYDEFEQAGVQCVKN